MNGKKRKVAHKLTDKQKQLLKELEIERTTNAKQELFCNYYASDYESFGNGVSSYIKAYGPDTKQKNWYKNACSAASQLLSNTKVCLRINELLELGVLNDTVVDKELSFVIIQKGDLTAKMTGIREYNKLKQRITDKLDLTSKGKKLSYKLVSYQETK